VDHALLIVQQEQSLKAKHISKSTQTLVWIVVLVQLLAQQVLLKAN
jgi:hypothetical protein